MATALCSHDRSGISHGKEASLTLDPVSVSRRTLEEVLCLEGLTPEAEKIVLQDYFDDGSGKAPRYYQANRSQRCS